MRKRLFSMLSLMVTIFVLVSCGVSASSEPAQLAFEAQMNVDSAQRFHVSLGVRNVGEARYRDYQAFNATMKLSNDSGEDLGSISVATLWELAPGNAGWPAAYASKLPAGAYQLTWGARDGDSIVVDFTIVELDGWLYLGEQSIRGTTGTPPEDSREYGALQSLADLARVNLAQKLGVVAEGVAVQSIEEAEFADASLGVPEPGQMYAQVLTPGYAIKLVVKGLVYEYRASEERLVFVPGQAQAPPGDPPGEAGQHTGNELEPPPAILEIAGREQVSGIGTYCWQEHDDTATPTGLCADMAGIPTAEEPLVVSSPFTAAFRLAPEETPDELLLEVIPVTAEDELERWPVGSRGWAFKQGERHGLRLERKPSIELSLEPGLYVLNLMGWWEAWGDASYGFLVEVQSPPPTLAVDEHAIVAAEVDGPGHFEYTDRFGADILARIEGLRAYAAGQELARANAALAPFGYRLEARFDAEWNRTYHDLYHESQAEPVLPGLSTVWPVSVNASGTDFGLAAENAPNVSPLYLLVQAGNVAPWDADQNAFLPPVYVGDDLARVTFTGFPTLTYHVELGNRVVYSGTAVAQGAYMPLRSLTAWDGHWALEVDDHLIMDGQDLGEALGYDAVYGFSLIHGLPFYFFEQQGRVHISYNGQMLPNAYDQVFHNQCCERAIHNVETLGDAVLFHALWNGTWYFVEAGVYDGEMAGTYRYTAPEGWSFRYPMHWDRLDEELGFVQDTATGRTVTFASLSTTQAELERWLESEIARKLAAAEAKNTLAEPLTTEQKGDLTIYRYAILSRLEASETLLRTTVFFDGQRRYEFYAAIPPVSEEEYEAILDSFQQASPSAALPEVYANR